MIIFGKSNLIRLLVITKKYNNPIIALFIFAKTLFLITKPQLFYLFWIKTNCLTENTIKYSKNHIKIISKCAIITNITLYDNNFMVTYETSISRGIAEHLRWDGKYYRKFQFDFYLTSKSKKLGSCCSSKQLNNNYY